MFKIISSTLALLIIIEVLDISPSSAVHLRQKRNISLHELGNAVSDILARVEVKIGEIDKEAHDASANVDNNTQMSPEQKKVAKDEIIKNAETKKMEERNKSKYDICILRKSNGQTDNGQTGDDCSNILNSQNANDTGAITAAPLASSTQRATQANFQQPVTQGAFQQSTQVTQNNFQQPQPTQGRALQQPTQAAFQQPTLATQASFQQPTVTNNGQRAFGSPGVVTTSSPLSATVTQRNPGLGFTSTVYNTAASNHLPTSTTEESDAE